MGRSKTDLNEVDDGLVDVAERGSRLDVEAELLLEVATERHGADETDDELSYRPDLILQRQSAAKQHHLPA